MVIVRNVHHRQRGKVGCREPVVFPIRIFNNKRLIPLLLRENLHNQRSVAVFGGVHHYSWGRNNHLLLFFTKSCILFPIAYCLINKHKLSNYFILPILIRDHHVIDSRSGTFAEMVFAVPYQLTATTIALPHQLSGTIGNLAQ